MSLNYKTTHEKKERDLSKELDSYRSRCYALGLGKSVDMIHEQCEGLGRRGDYLEYFKLKKLYTKFGGEK